MSRRSEPFGRGDDRPLTSDQYRRWTDELVVLLRTRLEEEINMGGGGIEQIRVVMVLVTETQSSTKLKPGRQPHPITTPQDQPM